jgi:hypothetical protein
MEAGEGEKRDLIDEGKASPLSVERESDDHCFRVVDLLFSCARISTSSASTRATRRSRSPSWPEEVIHRIEAGKASSPRPIGRMIGAAVQFFFFFFPYIR